MSGENREWKDLKTVIRERNPIDKLKAYDENYLKNIKSKNGKNLIFVSVKDNILPVTKYLIDIGCDINKKEQKNGCTPLSLALRRKIRKRGSSVKQLLENGADISWPNITEKNSNIICFGCNEVVTNLRSFIHKTYKKNAAKILISKGWPLDGIASLQDSDMTYSAITEIPGLKKKYEKFIYAVTDIDENENSNLKKIQQLLKILGRYKTIIGLALYDSIQMVDKSTGPAIVKMLLDLDAPINGVVGHCESPLIMAIADYNTDAAWNLMDHGAELDAGMMRIIEDTWLMRKKKSKSPICQEENASNFDSLFIISEHPAMKNFDLYPFDSFYNIIIKEYFFNLPCDWENTFESAKPIIKWFVRLYFFRKKELVQFWNEVVYRMKSFIIHHLLEYKAFFLNCIGEIRKMNEYKVGRIIILDVFIKPIETIIPYTRNEKLIEVLKRAIDENLDLYADFLKFKLNKANEKKINIDKSINVLSECLPLVGSSYLVLEKIVGYLGHPNKLT